MLDATTRARLVNAVTEYDRKQQGKRGYNHYALGHYCNAIQNVAEDMEEGRNIRAALLRCFNGRLLDVCLKAVGEAKFTMEEMHNQPICR